MSGARAIDAGDGPERRGGSTLAARPGASARGDTSSPLRPGDLLGAYRVGTLLGEGGQGVVHRGEHLLLGYPVAIKVLPDALAQHVQARSRLHREARLGALLRHRHLVGALDAGETPDGRPYLVMEYVEGPRLDDLLAQGPLPAAAAVELGLQLLAAVSALDARDIRHRDIKPDNVVLERPADGEVVARLFDFGVSKSSAEGADLRTLTRDGAVLGTPHFMPPEQARGEALDVRSDLYSVCAALYECLTGRPPHDGDTLTAVLSSVVADRAAPVRTVAPEVPAELAVIVDRGLWRERDGRWASPREMADALRAVSRRLDLPRGVDAWEGVFDDAEPDARPSSAAPARGQQTTARWVARLRVALATRALAPLLAASVLLPLAAGALGYALAGPSAEAVARKRAPARLEAPAPAPAAPAPTPAAPAPTPADAPAAAPEALEASARGLFVRGEAEAELSLYRRVTRRAPSRASAWRGRGLVASALGLRPEAENALRRYLSLDPSAPDAERIREELTSL